MPIFPEVPGPLPIKGGDLPARQDHAQALVPLERTRPEGTPVYDDARNANVALFREYERHAEEAAGQCSTLTATGDWLSSLGSDRKVFQQPGDAEEDYRARIFATPDLISPNAILAAVEAILAPYTQSLPVYADGILDSYFVEDGTATAWSSHVFALAGPSASESYPDRLYPELAPVNEGVFRPQTGTDGAMVTDGLGRLFVLRIPRVVGAGVPAFVIDESDEGLFADDGSATWSNSIFADGTDADGLYAAIVNKVEQMVAHSVRWTMIVDPAL